MDSTVLLKRIQLDGAFLKWIRLALEMDSTCVLEVDSKTRLGPENFCSNSITGY